MCLRSALRVAQGGNRAGASFHGQCVGHGVTVGARRRQVKGFATGRSALPNLRKRARQGGATPGGIDNRRALRPLAPPERLRAPPSRHRPSKPWQAPQEIIRQKMRTAGRPAHLRCLRSERRSGLTFHTGSNIPARSAPALSKGQRPQERMQARAAAFARLRRPFLSLPPCALSSLSEYPRAARFPGIRLTRVAVSPARSAPAAGNAPCRGGPNPPRGCRRTGGVSRCRGRGGG